MAKILWDLQTDKQVMDNELNIVVVDKLQKKAVLMDVSITRDQNI